MFLVCVIVLLQVLWRSMFSPSRKSASMTYWRNSMLQSMVAVLMILRWLSFLRWSFGCDKFIFRLNLWCFVLTVRSIFHISCVCQTTPCYCPDGYNELCWMCWVCVLPLYKNAVVTCHWHAPVILNTWYVNIHYHASNSSVSNYINTSC